MNAEIIGYTLRRQEWETLRLALKLADPFGAFEMPLDADACQAACDALYDLGVMTPGGDRMIVDGLFAFLIGELADASLALEGRAEARQFQLIRTPKMLVLVERSLTHATVTPLENLAAAQSLLEPALRHCAPPVVIELRDREAVLDSREAADPDTARAELARMFGSFAAHTVT